MLNIARAVIACVISFGVGRQTAPPRVLTKTVYENGKFEIGEYLTLFNSEIRNSVFICTPGSRPHNIHMYGNVFDLRSGGDVLTVVENLANGNVLLRDEKCRASE